MLCSNGFKNSSAKSKKMATHIGLKYALRHLLKNKLFSAVNILGLSLSGILVFLLMVFISTEKGVVHAEECAFSPPFGQYIVDVSLALGIALLTVSRQSWRAARRNPVEALRYE
jgi:ABC-type antimicrobial peptide transport system permease subunit